MAAQVVLGVSHTGPTQVVEKAGPLVVGGGVGEGGLGHQLVRLLKQVAAQVVTQQQVQQHRLTFKVRTQGRRAQACVKEPGTRWSSHHKRLQSHGHVNKWSTAVAQLIILMLAVCLPSFSAYKPPHLNKIALRSCFLFIIIIYCWLIAQITAQGHVPQGFSQVQISHTR